MRSVSNFDIVPEQDLLPLLPGTIFPEIALHHFELHNAVIFVDQKAAGSRGIEERSSN